MCIKLKLKFTGFIPLYLPERNFGKVLGKADPGSWE